MRYTDSKFHLFVEKSFDIAVLVLLFAMSLGLLAGAIALFNYVVFGTKYA